MKSKELILKTFQVKKTNLHSKQYVIPSKKFQDQLGMSKTWVWRIRCCWVAGYQWLQELSDAKKICKEKICLVDLKTGCIKTVVWKKKTTYNYKNLYKLMKMTPRLTNCRVTRTYFVLNHDILFNYFYEENEG